MDLLLDVADASLFAPMVCPRAVEVCATSHHGIARVRRGDVRRRTERLLVAF
jgi:hypothetical protein